jgi:hypothetical protein
LGVGTALHDDSVSKAPQVGDVNRELDSARGTAPGEVKERYDHVVWGIYELTDLDMQLIEYSHPLLLQKLRDSLVTPVRLLKRRALCRDPLDVRVGERECGIHVAGVGSRVYGAHDLLVSEHNGTTLPPPRTTTIVGPTADR